MSTQPPESLSAPPGRPAEPPPRRAPTPAARLIRAAGLFYAVLTGAAILWRVGWAGEPLLYADAEAASAGLDLLPDAALGAACAGLVVALSWVFARNTGWGERLARALADLVGRPSLGQIAVLALASSIGEEAFFRGALQPRVGLVAASLIFGLVHFIPRRDFLPWTGFSVAAGFLLGGLFEATGNLVAPVVTHAIVNGVNLKILVRDYGPSTAT